MFASLDIKSLYRSIQIYKSLSQIAQEEYFPQHVIKFSEHGLKNTYLRFSTKNRQKRS